MLKWIFSASVALTCQIVEAAELRIGLVQYDADRHFGEYDQNLANLTKFADQAVALGAQVIQLPEGGLYGYASETEAWCGNGSSFCRSHRCRDVNMVAESIPNGPSTEYWLKWSEGSGAAVLFNLPERDGDVFYNTTVAVGPSGDVKKYRKRALYVIDECYASPGTRPTTLTLAGKKLGLMTCMDANFSGFFADYRRDRVDGILISMDWDQDPRSPSRAAARFFTNVAKQQSLNIFASDVSKWDGTAWYHPDGSQRSRPGLPASAVGVDGVTVVVFQ